MKEDEVEYQVTMNGKIRGFPTTEEALDYILKNKDELYYCSIRKVVGRGCVEFVVNRV